MKGFCNCRTVSFSIMGALPNMYQCYCSLCQKQSGAGSNAATIVKSCNFEWDSGLESVKKWKKETGFNSYFCKDCGSPVPNPIGSDYVWIPVGLIRDIESKIVANLCLSSKPSWSTPQDAIRNYEEMPEDLNEFVNFLSSSA